MPLLRLLEDLLVSLRPVDLIDIGLIALFLYFFLAWLTQRASRPAQIAVLAAAGLYLTTHLLRMYLTTALFRVGVAVIILGLVLVFQQDIRRGFERLAAWRRPWFKAGNAQSGISDVLVDSAFDLARLKRGALVAVAGRESLEVYLRGGMLLDGAVSRPMLASIFDPHSPGHDGAVLIRDGRIQRFGVHLPLSGNLPEVGAGGTRHAAALGLAERSDALVIVVSEERGTVSVAQGGNLEQVASPSELKRRLEEFAAQMHPAQATQHDLRWWLKSLALKAASIVLAISLWILFAYPADTLQRSYLAPLEYRNVPSNWKLGDPRPTEARVVLSGPQRSFAQLDPDELIISVDVSDVSYGWQYIDIRDEYLRGRPPGLSVVQIEPRIAPIKAYRVELVELPIHVRLTGELPEHLHLEAANPERDSARVLLRSDELASINQVETAPIDLAAVTGTTRVRVPIVLPEGAYFAVGERATVHVDVHVSRGNRHRTG